MFFFCCCKINSQHLSFAFWCWNHGLFLKPVCKLNIVSFLRTVQISTFLLTVWNWPLFWRKIQQYISAWVSTLFTIFIKDFYPISKYSQNVIFKNWLKYDQFPCCSFNSLMLNQLEAGFQVIYPKSLLSKFFRSRKPVLLKNSS